MDRKPTQYEGVNSIVLSLLQKSQEILDDNLLAMYLHGSLAISDFNPKSSDVDFIVVLDKELSDESIQELRRMLDELVQTAPKWLKRLEGSYVPKGWLKSIDPPETPRPYINNGNLNIYPYGYEWVLEKFVIREKGIIITGPPPETFIEPVSADDLHRANVKILLRDWKPMLRESSRLKDDAYQAYAVLTMCRCLFLFVNNEMASKSTAVAWAQERFPEWKELTEVALHWTSGQKFDRLNEVKDFIQFTIEFTKSNKGEGTTTPNS